MQFANVDIRSLQFLTDSINRTIDALNQVRLSTYGTVVPNAFGFMPVYGGLAHAAVQDTLLNNPIIPYTALAAATGLGHTAFNAAYADPYGTARIAQTFPFVQQWGYSPRDWPTF